LFERHADVGLVEREVARLVGDGVDGAERHGVDTAFAVAHLDGADIDALDRAGIKMNQPVMTSCTSFCAPKPTARPMTPAAANSGVMFMPISASTTMVTSTIRIRRSAVRASGRSVRARVLMRPRLVNWRSISELTNSR
jgi:hypothetical protein